MYKCICKRCGHRLNRLFIVPEQRRERWVFECPECGHKSVLPGFSALAARAIHSGKCLTPLFAAAARGLQRMAAATRRWHQNRAARRRPRHAFRRKAV